jgi:hypothetical protein
MSTSIEIYSKLSEYLARRITLRDLESWLVPRLPIYLENPDSAVGQLAGVIELCLAELQAGIIAERSVRGRLLRYAPRESLIWLKYPNESQDDVHTAASSTAGAVNWEWGVPSQFWSIEPEVVNV